VYSRRTSARSTYDARPARCPASQSPSEYLGFRRQTTALIVRELLVSNFYLAVRSTIEPPAQLTRSVSAALAALNPNLRLTFRTLADQVNDSLAQDRLIAMLSGFFGALALLLAGLGLYGVTAYAVSRRTTEIGIRMALGAAAWSVVRLVLSRMCVLVAVGVSL
jgi:ABC-type antimicrobial peptide transport system permease subunit